MYLRQAAKKKVHGGARTNIQEKSKTTCDMELDLTSTPMAKYIKASGSWARDMVLVSSYSHRARNLLALSRWPTSGAMVLTYSKAVE